MATIASLVVSLSADSAKLKADLDKANSQTKKWAKDQSSSVKGLGTSFKDVGNIAVKVGATAVAAFTAVAAVFATGTLKVASYAKEIDRMSKSLNVAKGDFQAWTIAGKKVGLEQDKLSDIFKDVNERIGEYAATGSGPLTDFMDRVGKAQGIKVDDLLKLPTEGRFIAIQSAMENMNLPLEEQSFIWESLASDATYLIPLLTKGGAEFEKIKAQALATGQILSDDVINSLTSFQNNLSSIGNTMSGWGNILVSQYAPQLDALSGKMATFLANNEAIRTAFTLAGQAVGYVITQMSSAFSYLTNAFSGASQSTSALGSIIASLGPIFDYLSQRISGAWELIKVGGSIIWSAIKPGINILTEFGSVAVYALSAIMGPIGQVEGALSGGLLAALQQVSSAMAAWAATSLQVIQTVADYAKDAVDIIKLAFNDLPTALELLMVSAANAVISAVQSMVNGVIGILNKMLGFVSDQINKVGSAANAIGNKLGWGDLVGATDFGNIQDVTFDRVGLSGEAKTLGDEIGKTIGSRAAKRLNEQLQNAIPDPGMALGEFNLIGNDKKAPTAGTTGAARTITPYVKPDAASGSKGGSGGGSKGAGTKDTYTSGDKLTDALRGAGLDARLPQDGNDVASSFIDSIKTGFSDLLKGKSSFKEFMTGILDNVTSQIIDGFTNKLLDGFLGGIKWDDMFKGIGESAANAFKGIGSSISKWLGGLGSGGAGGFLSGIGGWLGGLMGFSEGGPVPSTPYSSPNKDSVLAMLQPGEYVIPVDQVKAIQDGRISRASGQTVNLNITGDISRQTRSEILRMIPQIAAGVRGNSKELGLS